MRGWVYDILVQFAVTLQSKSCRTHDHISLSHLRPYATVSYETPPTWRARPLYLYPQEQDGPVIPPGTGFPICRLLQLTGLQWRYSNPPPHSPRPSKSKLYYDRQSASPSWCQAPIWDPRPIFPLLSSNTFAVTYTGCLVQNQYIIFIVLIFMQF
jgi:hypothetical protein